MTTLQKHDNFVAAPMGDKLVTAVPGVGTVTAARLGNDPGITYAYQLYGHFLIRTEDEFKVFMQHAGGNAFIQTQAYNAFGDWKTNHQ